MVVRFMKKKSRQVYFFNFANIIFYFHGLSAEMITVTCFLKFL